MTWKNSNVPLPLTSPAERSQMLSPSIFVNALLNSFHRIRFELYESHLTAVAVDDNL